MKKTTVSIKFSIGVCIALVALLVFLIFFGPLVFEKYMVLYRGFSPEGSALSMLKKVFACCFYPCAVLALTIFYSLLRLLFNILKGEVFFRRNTRYLSLISFSLLLIGLITLAGGFFYMPFLFVALVGFFTGLMLFILKNVFRSAVLLKEENDLTI